MNVPLSEEEKLRIRQNVAKSFTEIEKQVRQEMRARRKDTKGNEAHFDEGDDSDDNEDLDDFPEHGGFDDSSVPLSSTAHADLSTAEADSDVIDHEIRNMINDAANEFRVTSGGWSGERINKDDLGDADADDDDDERRDGPVSSSVRSIHTESTGTSSQYDPSIDAEADALLKELEPEIEEAMKERHNAQERVNPTLSHTHSSFVLVQDESGSDEWQTIQRSEVKDMPTVSESSDATINAPSSGTSPNIVASSGHVAPIPTADTTNLPIRKEFLVDALREAEEEGDRVARETEALFNEIIAQAERTQSDVAKYRAAERKNTSNEGKVDATRETISLESHVVNGTEDSEVAFEIDGQKFTITECITRADELERKGEHRLAIKYFLYLLDGHKQSLTALQVIHCLERLATMCYYHKQYDQAKQFQHAIRLVYETQLVQLDVMQQPRTKPADPKARISSKVEKELSDSVKADIQRANQCERLGRMFFDKGNKEMAREYARRAIGIRKAIADRMGVSSLSEITPTAARVDRAVSEGKDTYSENVRFYEMKRSGVEDPSAADVGSSTAKLVGKPLDTALQMPVVEGIDALVGNYNTKSAVSLSTADVVESTLSSLKRQANQTQGDVGDTSSMSAPERLGNALSILNELDSLNTKKNFPTQGDGDNTNDNSPLIIEDFVDEEFFRSHEEKGEGGSDDNDSEGDMGEDEELEESKTNLSSLSVEEALRRRKAAAVSRTSKANQSPLHPSAPLSQSTSNLTLSSTSSKVPRSRDIILLFTGAFILMILWAAWLFPQSFVTYKRHFPK